MSDGGQRQEKSSLLGLLSSALGVTFVVLVAICLCLGLLAGYGMHIETQTAIARLAAAGTATPTVAVEAVASALAVEVGDTETPLPTEFPTKTPPPTITGTPPTSTKTPKPTRTPTVPTNTKTPKPTKTETLTPTLRPTKSPTSIVSSRMQSFPAGCWYSDKSSSFVVAICSVHYLQSTALYIPPQGMRFVAMEITVINNGLFDRTLDPTDFEMVSSGGVVITYDELPSIDAWSYNQILRGKLKAGYTVTGGFVFQVDNKAIPIGVIYGGGTLISFIPEPEKK